ncbi:MAG: hypothetical protein U5L09_08880 [Bacteroidales bacterium]|nr:hypothetical protein [Bacteroidales bacterium]
MEQLFSNESGRKYLTARSQDLPTAYHDAGMFYWLDYEHFLIEQQLFSQKGTGLILNETEVQDIDSETDWKLARIKITILIQWVTANSYYAPIVAAT